MVALTQSTPLAKPSQESSGKINNFIPVNSNIFTKFHRERAFTPISRNDFLYRLVRDTARLPMKRGGNSWTVNSLGYHGGLGKLFDIKNKRASDEMPMTENKRSLFHNFQTRSAGNMQGNSDYADFERNDVLRAAEQELLRRGYGMFQNTKIQTLDFRAFF